MGKESVWPPKKPKQNKTKKFSLPIFKQKMSCWCAESHHLQVCNSTWSWTWPSQEAFTLGHLNDIKIEAFLVCWNHQHPCRSKLETNQLVLKKARRICWTWARSSHFMWTNSSSRLYWPSWSRAWSGPVVIALADAQSGRLYWPNIGPILGLKVRFLLCCTKIMPRATFAYFEYPEFRLAAACA